MTNLLKTASLLTYLMFSQASFASNNLLASIQAENPEKTSYEILELFFSEAPSRADLSDFQLLYSVPDRKCVYVLSESPNSINDTIPLVQSTHTFPGIPAKGPLFPGTPNRTQVILSTPNFLETEYNREQVAIYQTIKINEKSFIIEDNYSNYNRVAIIRKGNDLLVTQTIVNGLISSYGYCWKE